MMRVLELSTFRRLVYRLLAAALLVTVLTTLPAHAEVTVGAARPSKPADPLKAAIVPGTDVAEPLKPAVMPGTGVAEPPKAGVLPGSEAAEPQQVPPYFKHPDVEHVWDPPGAPHGGTVIEGAQGRIVVDPNPDWGDWHDTDDIYYYYQPGGLRIDVWIDRGEWATYRPGEEIWVYFRVNRPCYVTILDYTTDGRVEVLYPNRWSSSSGVYPGRVYRVPDDWRSSLRIAGPGGMETLVACAHELPWPSGSHGPWLPSYRSWVFRGSVGGWGGRAGVVIEGGHDRPSLHRGRVVVGKPRGRVLAGVPSGRVVAGGPRWNSWRDWWPVHTEWHNYPGRWAYDSVSFRVASDWWDDDYWGGYLWERDDWDDDDWDDDWDGGSWNGHGQGKPLLDDHFCMSRPSDAFLHEIHCRGEAAYVSIDCTESRRGDPTEIVGRLSWNDGWGTETLFRLDVEGRHGEIPREGRVFVTTDGPLRVEIEITDVRLVKPNPWKPHRIKSIRFRVRATGC
jgi:hypothetical protein